jgi:type II restriction enzyme
MNLTCNPELALHLKSPSQKARVISEAWFAGQGYCLNCTSRSLEPTTAGTVARDYVCPVCGQPYELKSSAKAHTRIVNDGGYESMMRRIRAAEAPALMLLHRSNDWCVQKLVAIHPVFLTPAVVLKRKTAHTRPGSGVKYQMCDLNLTLIPPDGKILVVDDGRVRPVAQARKEFRESSRFSDVPLSKRGWAALVLSALRKIGKKEFTLADVYAHEAAMHAAYPENHHVRDKIRQQMQVLRDLGYVEFLSGRGEYRMTL